MTLISVLYKCTPPDKVLQHDLLFLSRWNTPLSDGEPGFLLLRNTPRATEEAKSRWEDGDSDGGMRGEERRVNDEKRTSRRLRTTVSAHHVVFPSFSSSVCLPPSSFITISPLLLLFLTPPSLPLCMFLPLLFRWHSFLHSSLFLQLSLCSSALVLSISLFSVLFFDLFFYSVHVYCSDFVVSHF